MNVEDKKMEEIQQQVNEQVELQKQIQQLENSVKPYLSKEAVSRYSNLKAAHPDKAVQALLVVLQAIQSGGLKGIKSDEMFKNLLLQLKQPKKEFRIIKK
jgi:DNA-binding TFAR19-related protein (PDSD5 family)